MGERDMHCTGGYRRMLRSTGIVGIVGLVVVALGLLIYSPGGDGLAVGTLTLVTDGSGYLPGETVTILGSGYAPDEDVTLQVSHAGGGAEAGMGHESASIFADPNGDFAQSWSINLFDTAGNNFEASAVGSISGAAAPAAFRRIARVETDKYDYQPGETAVISGSGFRPSEIVSISVEHSNGLTDGVGHLPFDALANVDGQISATWLVDSDDSEGSIFRLTATGADSGLSATATFTDVLITVIDDKGADDEPGQKDLNFLQVDYSPATPDVAVVWGWDDTAWSGNNTGDACTLFDTNGNGFANFSLCITVDQSGLYLATRLYICTADSRSDRCGGPTEDLTFLSTGSASIQTVDPFGTAGRNNNDCSAGGATGCLINDTVANLTVKLADVGGGSARLINVCSYPSQEPNSDPSDCVINENNGLLNICKVATPNDSTQFTFNLGSGQSAQNGQNSWTVTGSRCVNLISFPPSSTNDLSEATLPAGWTLTGASCTINTQPSTTPTGSYSSPTVSNFEIRSGLETTCTFTDVKDLCLGVTCNDNNACTDDACNPANGLCVNTNDNTNTCGSASDTVCDNPDTCSAGACLVNNEGTSTPCSFDTNACTDDHCDGAGACTATNDDTNTCGSSGNTDCDNPDTCSAGACLSNNEPVDTACTSDGVECTDDVCGVGGVCTHPNDDTNTCGSASDTACDNPDTCSAGVCLINHEPGTTTCGDAGGECTNQDYCDPSTGLCHDNGYKPVTTACGSTADTDCDNPDHCSGTNGTCVPNYESSGTLCRASSGQCDVADYCTGSGSCSTDGYKPPNTPCNDGSVCTVGDSCDGQNHCVGGPPLSCSDGVDCTQDLCNAVTGCYSKPTDSCSGLTDTEFCPLPNNQFRLIDITDGSKDPNTTQVLYTLNSSNPGQFYYNVLVTGAPSSAVNLTISIPYPFVTQGAVPIQIHDSTGFYASGANDCFIPGPSLPGYTVTTQDDSIKSSSGNPVILLAHPTAGDYDALELDKTTDVTVTGVMPSTGLLYVTIHLDYGLKKSTGWTKVGTNAAFHPAFSLADADVTILDGQVYPFSTSSGVMSNPASTNVFKKNPGFGNMTLRSVSGDPKANVSVQIIGPTGKLLGTVLSDQDGYAMYTYKHTGKTANFTVKLPLYNLQKTVPLKANGYALTVFDTLP